MSRIRVTQDVIEVLQNDSGFARVTQSCLEVLQAYNYTPVTPSNITSGTGATTSSQATASHTPSINTLYILTVVAKDSTSANTTPTATHAGGLTWTSVAHVTNGVTGFSETVFRAMKPSGLSAGTTTIDFGGVSQTIVGWSIDQYVNADASGTNGSGALVQSVTGNAASGTSLSITLATLALGQNLVAGSFGHNVNEAITVGSNYQAIGSGNTTLLGFKTEYQYNSTTVNASWATTAVNVGVAYEIRAAGLGGPPASFGAAVSQDVIEVIAVESAARARVSQHVLEVMVVENQDPTSATGGATAFGYAV